MSLIASRTDSILLVIDIQERLAAAMHHAERVTSSVVFLAGVAAVVGAPVVVTRQYPRGLGGLVPGLVSHGAPDVLRNALPFDKLAFDCFEQEGFEDLLVATGRRQVIIAGMETHICVTQTALSALARGYDVHVVVDGCCSRDDAAHDTAVQRLSAAGATLTVAESVAYEWIGRAGTDEFKALLGLVKG